MKARLPWAPLAAVALLVALAVAAPLLKLPSPVAMDVAHRLAGPSPAHWLGQDEYGRDILTRLVWGARTSLGVAAASVALAAVIGTALGLAAGFLRGVVAFVTLRTVDVMLCFPPLLLALLVVTLAGPGVLTLIPVLALVTLPGFARVAYASVLVVRGHDYVEAVRVLGASRLRIMARTILPNIAGPVLVQLSLSVAAAILLESGLSFLGLGVVPPAPSWGLMIGAARATMAQAPLLLLWPCLALTLTVLAINALCDGLRDWTDPHGRLRRPRLRDAFAPGLLPISYAVLEVRNLIVEIDTPAGPIRPVRDVSLTINKGRTLALVGESGSGKSMTALALMGLLPDAARVVQGAASLEEQPLLGQPEESIRRLRGERMAMVFQDPASALNPVHRVGDQITEAIGAHRRPARDEAVSLMRRVGIPDHRRRARSFPHELSGGMRQRVMIAMAVANTPRLLIADEPTTALDVTVEAQILDLLADIRRERGMSLLFITHSLPVVAQIADEVAVMYAGEVVERGPVADVFADPLHPYTEALLRSAPTEDGAAPVPIPGTVTLPHALPAGCAFAPRCPYRIAACDTTRPSLVEAHAGWWTRCLRWAES